MTYEEWHTRLFTILLKDPDSSERWWRTKAIGLHDARTKAAFFWPLSEILDVREADGVGGGTDGMTVHAVPDPNFPEAPHDICSGCGCWFTIPDTWEPNKVSQWCDPKPYPGRNSNCECHLLRFVEEWIRDTNGGTHAA